jgi:predicted flap endonuclease-1-like 5' DNA nuclease/chromosome segregation ATPase
VPEQLSTRPQFLELARVGLLLRLRARNLAQDLEARQQELNDLEGRLDRWQGSLVVVLADTESPVAVDTEVVAGAVAKAGQLDGLLQGVMTQAREQHQALVDARARIAHVHSELVAALAAREAVDGQLATREMVLNDLNHQIDRQGEKLQAILPLELTQPAEGEGLRLIGITALADTVDKAIQASANQAAAAVELEDQVNGLAAEKASLEASLQEQEAALAAAHLQVQALQGTVDDLNAQIQALQVERDSSYAEKGELQQTVEKLEAQVNGLAAEKANLEASLQEQEAALAAAHQRVQALQGTVEDLNAQIQALQVDRSNAHAEKDELQQTLAMREGELGVARQQVTDFQSQVAATEAQLQDVLAQIAGLQAQTEAESGELNELRSRAAMIWPFETRSALALALEDRPAVKREAASAALVAGAEPQLVPHVQDLSKVKGIGAARRQRLYNSGVGTYWELAHIPDEAMQQILELTKTQSSTFDFPAARAEAYELARDSESLGWIWEGQRVDDFEPMAGIGATYEQRLYEHGIYTYQQLADTSEEELAQIIDAPEMQQPDYAGWIAEAQVLAEQQRQAAIEALKAEVEEKSTELPDSTAGA